MSTPLTPEERREVRQLHEQRMVACTCNWSEPCLTIRLLNALEAAERGRDEAIKAASAAARRVNEEDAEASEWERRALAAEEREQAPRVALESQAPCSSERWG